jgi:hypothetical protein
MTAADWAALRDGRPGSAVVGYDYGGRRHTLAVANKLAAGDRGGSLLPRLRGALWAAGVLHYESRTEPRESGEPASNRRADKRFVLALAAAVLEKVWA